jgi:hypothetical protein
VACAIAVAPSLPPVPRHGVSLAALAAFAAQHAGGTHSVLDSGASGAQQQVPFAQLTTAHVVEAIVKPATLRAGTPGGPCTYAELLLAQARGAAPELGTVAPPRAAPDSPIVRCSHHRTGRT